MLLLRHPCCPGTCLQYRHVRLLVWEGEAWEAMQICLVPQFLLPALHRTLGSAC